MSALSPFCWSTVITFTSLIVSHWPSVVVVARSENRINATSWPAPQFKHVRLAIGSECVQPIVAVASVDGVGAPAAEERVVARVAVDGVVALAAARAVVIVSAVDGVVTRAAVHAVVTGVDWIKGTPPSAWNG